jgi:hypothetical protein
LAPDRLRAGDLKGFGSLVQQAIRKAAKSDVIALAAGSTWIRLFWSSA